VAQKRKLFVQLSYNNRINTNRMWPANEFSILHQIKVSIKHFDTVTWYNILYA